MIPFKDEWSIDRLRAFTHRRLRWWQSVGLLVVLLAGCGAETHEQKVRRTFRDHGMIAPPAFEYQAIMLYELDGHKVYRFRDGADRYYVIQGDSAIRDIKTGKQLASDTIQTVDTRATKAIEHGAHEPTADSRTVKP